MTASRTSFGPNIIDTVNLFDGCITGAKVATATITSDKLAAGILTNGTRCGLAYAEITGLPLTAGKLTAGTYPIGTIPGGSLITACIAVARIAFDGNAALTVGRSAAQTSLLPTTTLTLAAVTGQNKSTDCGTELATSDTPPIPIDHWVANDTVYNAYLTNTTGTVGALDVYIFYIRGVMSG
jgi:hypothetical protein